MEKIEKGHVIQFIYKNYKKEVSNRTVVVDELYLGSNQWHPKNQFLLTGLDLDKKAMRCFAVKDMSHIALIVNEWGRSRSV